MMSVSLTESNQGAGFDKYLNNINIPASSSSVSAVCEIEEENSNELFEINQGLPMLSIKEEMEGSLFSVDVDGGDHQDNIYVAVGKSESSMSALSWTLQNAVNPTTIIYLIHVFPEVKHIPSPLGKLPKSQVSPEQLESYMAQERGKRRELLQKFLDACTASKVRVETMLIESDGVAKAILDLIPILNIRKLVVGTSKSNIRKLKSRRGSGIADQVLQSAPETCEIKIVCEAKEVIEQMIESPSPRGNDQSPKATPQENEINSSFSCMCFKSKFI